jgi:hypothetical protein|nr:MAG: capsid protein [Cressdnaviricota sp.]
MTMPRKRTRKPSRSRRRTRRTTRGFRRRKSRITTMVMKKPGDYMPERFMCKLRYWDNTTGLSNTSTPYFANYTYKMNSAYDPDPAVGSGAIPGFTELAAFYTTYRVVGFAYKVTFNNASEQSTWPYAPYTIYCGAYNTYNTSSVTPPSAVSVNNSSVYNLCTNPYFKKKMLGVQYSGKDTQTISGFVSFKKLLGLKSYDYDPFFEGNTNGEPNNKIWFVIGAVYNGTQTLSASNELYIPLDFTFTYYIEFYQRKNLTS